MEMDALFILQISLEMGFGGGSECVAFELHRAWQALGIDTRAVTSHATELEARQGISFVAPWLMHLGLHSRWRHLAALVTVPLFTLAASWRVKRSGGSKIVLSHGDSLIGDVCVVHAVNRASLAEKRRTGYYGWLLNPSNLWVAWRDWWMLRGGRYRRIVAISERVRQQLKQYYNVPDERIVTIPNGINLRRFNPGNARSRDAVRQSFLAFLLRCSVGALRGQPIPAKRIGVRHQGSGRDGTRAVLLVMGADGRRRRSSDSRSN